MALTILAIWIAFNITVAVFLTLRAYGLPRWRRPVRHQAKIIRLFE